MFGVIKERLTFEFRDKYRSRWHLLLLELNILQGKFRRIFSQPSLPITTDNSINLHLGCGEINHPMFINIDAVPGSHVHFVRSVDNLSIFKDCSVDLIYSSHCLEHFSHRYVPLVLAEWYRVLKPGGILRLSVPDFNCILNIYHDTGDDALAIVQPLMGGQDYKFNYHYSVFTQKSLSTILANIGFKTTRLWTNKSDTLTDFDDWSGKSIEIYGKKYEISLNLEAEK